MPQHCDALACVTLAEPTVLSEGTLGSSQERQESNTMPVTLTCDYHNFPVFIICFFIQVRDELMLQLVPTFLGLCMFLEAERTACSYQMAAASEANLYPTQVLQMEH